MAMFAGTMMSGAGPAQADQITYTHYCGFSLMAPDHAIVVPIEVYGYFRTSTSGASVLAESIDIYNDSDHEIIVDENRWQPADGTMPERGPAQDIPSGKFGTWRPKKYFQFETDPSIVVHAYAKSRPAMKGGVICLARPAPGG